VVTFYVTLPYPWVTQGAQPIQAYDGVRYTTGSGGQVCLTPANVILPVSTQVTLANYAPQAFGSTYSFPVTVTVPATGFIFLTVHLDYGLKGTLGYNKNANTPPDAVQCGTSTVLIPGSKSYSFSVAGTASGGAAITSMNVFKKNPGVGGLVSIPATETGISGAAMTLLDSTKKVLATATSDTDGWYMLPYKYTGKATTLYVTCKPPTGVGASKTNSVAIKSNAYVESNFNY
jgi:hypothetical protein